MSKYFVVKASGANVSLPVLDSTLAKPYLVIKNKGYVPLTTETGTSGVKVKGRNGRIYGVAKTTTVQRSSTFISDCTTTYTSPEDMQDTVSNADVTATYMDYSTYSLAPNSTFTYFSTSKKTFTYGAAPDMWLSFVISKQPGAQYYSTSTTNTRSGTRKVVIQDYSISVSNKRSPTDNNAGYLYIVGPRQTTSYKSTLGSSTDISALFKTTRISYSITSSSQIVPYAKLITKSAGATGSVTLTTLYGGNNGNNDSDVRVTTYTPQDITVTFTYCFVKFWPWVWHILYGRVKIKKT